MSLFDFEIPVEFEDIKLEENLLEKVICQAKFYEILSLKGDSIAEFQDKIREDYPKYDRIIKFIDHFDYTSTKEPTKPERTKEEIYVFSNIEGTWKIELSTDKITLAMVRSKAYENFDKLRKNFLEIIEHLDNTVNNRIFYNYLGLRYINFIPLNGLTSYKDWSHRINPKLLGVLDSGILDPGVLRVNYQETRLKKNELNFTLKHGLVQNRKDRYSIDFDCSHIGEYKRNDIGDMLNRLHDEINCLFIWSLNADYLRELLVKEES